MALSTQQIEQITYELDFSSLKSKHLKEDLLDHFCCAVEVYMSRKFSFSEAFERAKQDICPDGLEEIQKETIYLLNYKKIKFMKRILFIFGFVFCFLFAIGFMFKTLRWPYGGMMLIIGTLGIGFIFLPLLSIHYYRLKANKILSEKMKYVLGTLSAFTFSLSVAFRLLHLPLADITFALSILLFSFGFLPFFFFKMYKKSI